MWGDHLNSKNTNAKHKTSQSMALAVTRRGHWLMTRELKQAEHPSVWPPVPVRHLTFFCHSVCMSAPRWVIGGYEQVLVNRWICKYWTANSENCLSNSSEFKILTCPSPAKPTRLLPPHKQRPWQIICRHPSTPNHCFPGKYVLSCCPPGTTHDPHIPPSWSVMVSQGNG